MPASGPTMRLLCDPAATCGVRRGGSSALPEGVNAAPSSSLPFRETQGKIFLRLVLRQKVFFDQYLGRACPAESEVLQGSGRETRKPFGSAFRIGRSVLLYQFFD